MPELQNSGTTEPISECPYTKKKTAVSPKTTAVFTWQKTRAFKPYLLLCRFRLSFFFRLCVAIFARFLFFPQGTIELLNIYRYLNYAFFYGLRQVLNTKFYEFLCLTRLPRTKILCRTRTKSTKSSKKGSQSPRTTYGVGLKESRTGTEQTV